MEAADRRNRPIWRALWYAREVRKAWLEQRSRPLLGGMRARDIGGTMTDVIKTHANALPAARNIHWNPSPAELRELTSRMPNARHTEYDNYNVQTKVVSRSKGSTYVVTDRPEEHSDQTMTVADGALIAERQDAYIRDQDMLVIDGYIGNDAQRRVPARLYIEAANANIAGMQRWLYF